MTIYSLKQLCLIQLTTDDLPTLQELGEPGSDAAQIAVSSLQSLKNRMEVPVAIELEAAVTAQDYPKICGIYQRILQELENECAFRGIKYHKSMPVERALISLFFSKMKYNLSCSLSRSPEGAAYIQEIRTIFGDQLPFTWEKGIALMDQLLASPRLNQTVASLLKYGGDPSLHFLQHLITHYPHAIDAILPLAILWIDAEMAQQLLEKGANPLFEGEFPPALSLAVMVRIAHNFKSYTDLEKCVKLLLQHQANPNLQDHQGNTPLHHAVQRHIEFRGIAQLLLEHGADPNLRNDDNMPPLRIAFDPQMKALLLEHGAQPEDEEEQEQLLSSQASDNSIDSAGEDFSDLIDNLASGAENSDDEDFSGFIDNLASSAEDSDDNAP